MERYIGIIDIQTQHTNNNDLSSYLLEEFNSYQNIGKFLVRHTKVYSEFV